jgi:iron uptake system component EfeO
MGSLAGAARKLDTAIRSGDPERARKAWLTAHLVYERLGAAYGTFGDADAAINGTTAGLAGGVHDRDFTGFHRIEYGLWHGESATALRPFADRLVKDVLTLRTTWQQARMDPLDLGLRAHEILENTVQFELTGRTDYGSGSNLATARANLDGTRVVLSRLRPVLTGRYPGLKELDAALDRTGAVLDRQEHGGHWVPPARLSRTEREKVNAAVSGLVERLADIAALCDVRRSS